MSASCAEVAVYYEKFENLKKDDVEDIFNWLEENPYLPKLTELQVILFLSSCSYNVDSTKKTIQNYFSFKEKSNLLVMIDENFVKKATPVAFMGFLPNRTPRNEMVAMLKFLDPNPENFNCEECVKFTMNHIILHMNQYGPSNGIILILDSENMSFGHFWRMKLGALRQILYFVQEAAPMILKGVHLTNVLPVTKHMIFFLKPFIKQEIYELIKIHSDSFESLYEYVPKECLPKEFGGELDYCHIINENNTKIVLANMKLLEELHAQNIDESKIEIEKKRGFFGTIYDYFA